MKRLFRWILPVIMMFFVPAIVEALPRDCRFITNPKIIAKMEVLRPKSEFMGFAKQGTHLDVQHIRYCTDSIDGSVDIHAAIRDSENNIRGLVIFRCLGISNSCDAMKALEEQKDFQLQRSYCAAFSSESCLEEFEFPERIRYWDPQNGVLYKEPHEGCEELLMYIRD
jgi:hypothetical protein